MSTLCFHNSLTRRKEPFVSRVPGEVGMYTCGPTVYNFAHIGNFRAYVFEDLLRRHLQFKGFRVRQVMNLTDVDDKTIRDSRAAGLPLGEFTAIYKKAFFEDLKVLNIEPAEVYPAATDHIPEMIALIERLFAAGVAYRAGDGSVYFAVDKFPAYGALARLDRENMRAGDRVARDEYEKASYGDFALWKAWEESDGDVAWDSPWGRGRPGWHIECSAMGMKYLGESFDIHTGGIDNLFPHHENEIAQAEAATGKKFVTTWLHCAHLNVDGEKMSKSKGNFYTLRDILARGYAGREIRYLLLATHYRAGLNFSFAGLDAARTALRRLDESVRRFREAAGGAAAGDLPDWAKERASAFEAAMDDDLNISAALGEVFDTVRAGNAALDAGAPAETAAALADLFRRWDKDLGVLEPAGAEAALPEEVQKLVDARAAARKAKDWAESDRLRGELAKAGWAVKDTPKGQVVSRA
jgi:cysteinyl-tRNA synthetase